MIEKDVGYPSGNSILSVSYTSVPFHVKTAWQKEVCSETNSEIHCLPQRANGNLSGLQGRNGKLDFPSLACHHAG
jgi:hypothetical protein